MINRESGISQEWAVLWSWFFACGKELIEVTISSTISSGFGQMCPKWFKQQVRINQVWSWFEWT